MSKRDTILLIEDMLDSELKIRRYTKTLTFDLFIEDEKTIDAVVRNFEIVGETANRIDQDFRIKNPEIEWLEVLLANNKTPEK